MLVRDTSHFFVANKKKRCSCFVRSVTCLTQMSKLVSWTYYMMSGLCDFILFVSLTYDSTRSPCCAGTWLVIVKMGRYKVSFIVTNAS